VSVVNQICTNLSKKVSWGLISLAFGLYKYTGILLPQSNCCLPPFFGRWLGDNADLVILKDAAHAPQVEVAQEYNKKVLEFLTRPPRGEYHANEVIPLHRD